ncbi:uncharacterized protein LOC144602515 [Rhinoraja longicauda]
MILSGAQKRKRAAEEKEKIGKIPKLTSWFNTDACVLLDMIDHHQQRYFSVKAESSSDLKTIASDALKKKCEHLANMYHKDLNYDDLLNECEHLKHYMALDENSPDLSLGLETPLLLQIWVFPLVKCHQQQQRIMILLVRKLFPAQTDLAKRLLLIFLSVVILQVYFATEEEPGLSSTALDSPSDLPWYGAALIPTAVGDEAKPQSVVDGHLLIEKFETPFLYNKVLAETSDAIKQVSLTLDVETAHPWLEVSEDRKRVRWTGTERSLPDTGKRFTYWPYVLGSEGFTSGRHYWEVEVAGSEDWSLGVAAESVERKERVTLTPETGVWSIRRWDDEFDAVTSPPSPLPARPIPGRVGVYLSYESGTVSFYDADTKSHLHTVTGNKFTEKLYPFFATWDDGQWLIICSGSAPGV